MLKLPTQETIKAQIARKITFDDIESLNSAAISHLITTACGINIFGEAQHKILPKAFASVHPWGEFEPDEEDRQNAIYNLKILEAYADQVTRDALAGKDYSKACAGIGLEGGEFLLQLMSMLPPSKKEEVFREIRSVKGQRESIKIMENMVGYDSYALWMQRHNYMVTVVLELEKNGKLPLSEEQLIGLAFDAGVLDQDGNPSFKPNFTKGEL